jgi:hypothetical protein
VLQCAADSIELYRSGEAEVMKKSVVMLAVAVIVSLGFGCSYHRAYISYSQYKEDVRVAATGWEGQRLGTVSAGEGGAIWERCTDVAEGSMWVLMEDARRMGGNALGDIRWVPQNPGRTTEEPTCKKKWGWFLVWPVLVTPGFMSARVEAVAYAVPGSGATREGLYLIPDDPDERAAVIERIVADGPMRAARP